VTHDALVIAAQPDDAETQMRRTLAKLSDAGLRLLLLDLTHSEPTEFASRVEVSDVYERNRRALGVYTPNFPDEGERLLALYRAEDQCHGRLLGVPYAEVLRSGDAKSTGQIRGTTPWPRR
jgi:hypothetical protein